MARRTKHYYESSDFKQLQRKWYVKLRKRGFVDIELTKQLQPSQYLSHNQYQIERSLTTAIHNLTRSYFDLMCMYRWVIHYHTKYDPLDIWLIDLFCDGYSEPEIRTITKQTKYKVKTFLTQYKSSALSYYSTHLNTEGGEVIDLFDRSNKADEE